MVKLFVNIDHIATVREARRVREPDPVTAAVMAETAGADGITAHLREDRRHIKDRDVRMLKEILQAPFNLEMAPTQEMLGIALSIKPFSVTLVPEKREELTTEGGLDLHINKDKLESIISTLREGKIIVSLFIDPEIDQIKLARKLGAQSVELHTGQYAECSFDDRGAELEKLEKGAVLAQKIGLKVNLGHGLNYSNTGEAARIPGISELNIGHSIVARSSLVGISEAVKQMKEIILKNS